MDSRRSAIHHEGGKAKCLSLCMKRIIHAAAKVVCCWAMGKRRQWLQEARKDLYEVHRILTHIPSTIPVKAESCLPEAFELTHRALASLQQANLSDPALVCLGLGLLGSCYLRKCEYNRAEAKFVEALKLIPDPGSAEHKSVVSMVECDYGCMLHALCGRDNEAEAILQRSLDRGGIDINQGMLLHVVLAEIALGRGQAEEAARLCDMAVEMNKDVDKPIHTLLLLACLGNVAEARGEMVTALKYDHLLAMKLQGEPQHATTRMLAIDHCRRMALHDMSNGETKRAECELRISVLELYTKFMEHGVPVRYRPALLACLKALMVMADVLRLNGKPHEAELVEKEARETQELLEAMTSVALEQVRRQMRGRRGLLEGLEVAGGRPGSVPVAAAAEATSLPAACFKEPAAAAAAAAEGNISDLHVACKDGVTSSAAIHATAAGGISAMAAAAGRGVFEAAAAVGGGCDGEGDGEASAGGAGHKLTRKQQKRAAKRRARGVEGGGHHHHNHHCLEGQHQQEPSSTGCGHAGESGEGGADVDVGGLPSHGGDDDTRSPPPQHGVDESKAQEQVDLQEQQQAQTAVEKAAEECPVCLCSLDSDGYAARTLICGHEYHAVCLDAWLEKCRAVCIPATCPYCRQPAVPK